MAHLDQFLSDLSVAATTQQSWDEIVSFQNSLGFDLVMYGYASIATEESELEVRTMSNFPDPYQERYRRDHYERDDPLVQHCIANLTPRMIGPNALDRWPDRGRTLSPAQRRIMDEAADCGMKIGMVVPLRSPGRHPVGGISMANGMTLDEYERFIADRGQAAQLAALYAHTRIQMQLQDENKSSPHVDLTAREKECLLWTAHGLSSKEAATRLNVTARTIDFHIANAMTKLNAASRCQAVARAIFGGHITP